MKRRRRHHNTDGRTQIKLGYTHEQVKRIAKRLGIPYGKANQRTREDKVQTVAEAAPPLFEQAP